VLVGDKARLGGVVQLRENVDQDTVSDIVRKMANLPESVKPAANHLIDFEIKNRIFPLSGVKNDFGEKSGYWLKPL